MSTTGSQPIDLVIFDLDGTLTDAGPGIMHAAALVLGRLGIDDPAEDELAAFVGPPVVDHLADRYGVPEADLADLVGVYRDYYSREGMYENSVYDGVPELLTSLAGSGLRLGVATSKVTETAVAVLEHFGLASYFEVVGGATADGLRRRKVDVLDHTLELLGRPPVGSTLMIGDRRHDMEAAGAHGVTAVGVLWGYGDEDELLAAGADHLVAAPRDVLELL